MAKRLVEHCIELNIVKLNPLKISDERWKRLGYTQQDLEPSFYICLDQCDDDFTYKVIGLRGQGSQEIPTVRTFCYFGGNRYWWLCKCKRRALKLYWGSRGWLCRVCYGLAYESQRTRIRGRIRSVDDWLDKMEKRYGL